MNHKETKTIIDTLIDDESQCTFLWKELSRLEKLANETQNVRDHVRISNAMCNIAKTILKVQW